MFDYAQKIMESPDAPIQIEALHQAMQTEQSRRHDFREWITPNVKAEFINGEVILHSPVKKRHWSVTDLLSSLLSFYVRFKQMGRVGTEKVMIALTAMIMNPIWSFFQRKKRIHSRRSKCFFLRQILLSKFYPNLRAGKIKASKNGITPRMASENIGLLTRFVSTLSSTFCSRRLIKNTHPPKLFDSMKTSKVMQFKDLSSPFKRFLMKKLILKCCKIY